MLWTALPIRGVTDPKEVLDVYLTAVQDCSPMAVRSTVEALTAGRIEEANAKFCPSTAELGRFARAEQRRLDALNRPPAISYSVVKVPFKDWRIIHRQAADALKELYWVKYPKEIEHEEFRLLARRGRIRPGSTWFWSIQEAWMPPAVLEAVN
jgi:hypothetical protein